MVIHEIAAEGVAAESEIGTLCVSRQSSLLSRFFSDHCHDHDPLAFVAMHESHGDCSCKYIKYQKLICPTILIIHACVLTGHMTMVVKETSIMKGKRTGELAEIGMLMRKRGEGAQVGTGQGGMVLRAGKLTKVIQPSFLQTRKEQNWA